MSAKPKRKFIVLLLVLCMLFCQMSVVMAEDDGSTVSESADTAELSVVYYSAETGGTAAVSESGKLALSVGKVISVSDLTPCPTGESFSGLDPTSVVIASSDSGAESSTTEPDYLYYTDSTWYYYVLAEDETDEPDVTDVTGSGSGWTAFSSDESLYFIYPALVKVSVTLVYWNLSNSSNSLGSTEYAPVEITLTLVADQSYQVNKMEDTVDELASGYYSGKTYSYAVEASDSTAAVTSTNKATWIKYDSAEGLRYSTDATTTTGVGVSYTTVESGYGLYFLYFTIDASLKTLGTNVDDTHTQATHTWQADNAYSKSDLMKYWSDTISGYTISDVQVLVGGAYTSVQRVMYGTACGEYVSSSGWYYRLADSGTDYPCDLDDIYLVYKKNDIAVSYNDGYSYPTGGDVASMSLSDTVVKSGDTTCELGVPSTTAFTQAITQNGETVYCRYVWAGWTFATEDADDYKDEGITLTAYDSSSSTGQTLTVPENVTVTGDSVSVYSMYTISTGYGVTYDWGTASDYSDTAESAGISLPDEGWYAEGETVTVSDITTENSKYSFDVTYSNGLTRTWTFAGWNTASDGSGTAYKVGDTFTMRTDAVSLYAQWERTGVTVSATPKLSEGVNCYYIWWTTDHFGSNFGDGKDQYLYLDNAFSKKVTSYSGLSGAFNTATSGDTVWEQTPSYVTDAQGDAYGGYLLFIVEPQDGYIIISGSGSGNNDLYPIDVISDGDSKTATAMDDDAGIDIVAAAIKEKYPDALVFQWSRKSAGAKDPEATFTITAQKPSISVDISVSGHTGTSLTAGSVITFAVAITPDEVDGAAVSGVQIASLSIFGQTFTTGFSELSDSNGDGVYTTTYTYTLTQDDIKGYNLDKFSVSVTAETTYSYTLTLNNNYEYDTTATVTNSADVGMLEVQHEFKGFSSDGDSLDLPDEVTDLLPNNVAQSYGSSYSLPELRSEIVSVGNGSEGTDIWAFEGWYTDEDCTESAADPITVESVTTLYGKWVKNDTMSLTVKKKVEGNMGDKNKAFSFTLGDSSGNPVTTFTLTDGKTYEIKNLVVGSTITLKESDADDYTIVIAYGDTTYNVTSDTDQRITLEYGVTEITVTNTYAVAVPSAVKKYTAPYIAALLCAGFGGLFLLRRKRKRE